METTGSMSEVEWSSYSGMYSTEEADFMAQLLGGCLLPNEPPGGLGFRVPSFHKSNVNMAEVEEGLMYSSDKIDTSMYYFSQGTNYSVDNGGMVFPNSGLESYYFSDSHYDVVTNNSSMFMDCSVGEDKNTNSIAEAFTDSLMESGDSLSQDMAAVLQGKNLQLKVQSEMPVVDSSTEDKNNPTSENSKKRSSVSGEVQKKRNVKSKKNQKLVLTTNNDADDNAGLDRQSSRSYCLEDDSNASQEPNRGTNSSSSSKEAAAMNLNAGKASRGSASDPQSLYARKRRERINERLRILQNLVPNGTKVDISTMLEEAVQYVKFLQLQIKLLSSDDLWMYAPLAYNGLNIGLDLKTITPR